MNFEHTIFQTELNLFKNITEPAVYSTTTLQDILCIIPYNYDVEIDLNPKFINGIKNCNYDKIKKQSFATCYNAFFDSYKTTTNLVSTTSIMFFDFDFLTTTEALVYKEKIKSLDFVIAANLSISKTGLHVLIYTDTIVDNEDFNIKYKYVNETFFNNLADKQASKLSQFCILGYDNDIYINDYPNQLDLTNRVNKQKGATSDIYKKEYNIQLVAPFQNPVSSIEQISNEAGRTLSFRENLPESNFIDPNEPIYISEGIEIVKLNLFAFKGKKVNEGKRNSFIGALGAQLIYINRNNTNENVKDEILKYLFVINVKMCNPPMPFKDVQSSFLNNWKRFLEGNLNVDRYKKNQKNFWSSKCILTGNEKRIKTCAKRSEAIKDLNRSKIENAINDLKAEELKITQLKVAEYSNLSLRTVKSYWKEFKNTL